MFSFVINRVLSVYHLIYKNKGVYYLGFFSSVIFTYTYYSYIFKKKNSNDIKPVTEVLFFTDANANHNDYSRDCKCTQCGIKNLKKLIIYIDSAQVSLDICVYTISNTKLGEAVLRKYKEGIKIRIITDASMSFEIGSQIPLFMKNGIMVRSRESQFLMHHKFAIIDNKLLINGSFNWTEKATFGNWENITITSVPHHLVQRYCSHFETLWKLLY